MYITIELTDRKLPTKKLFIFGTWDPSKIEVGTESQRTPFSKLLARAIRYSGFFGVRSFVGPTVGQISWYLEDSTNNFEIDVPF